MKVLMITGDQTLRTPGTSAYARFALQREAVEELTPVYWGRGHWFDVFRIKKMFDVITAQDPFLRGLVAWILARQNGARLNLQVHTDLSAQSAWRQTLATFLLRRADSVRVVSQKIKEQVIRMGVRSKITVLPVFVDPLKFTSVVRRLHASKNILWTGRFEEEKNPLQAIEILKEVLKAGVDARLTVLGAGSMEKQLRHLAEGLPVDFPGWQAPEIYLEIADVVLCTSRHESWGASMVEALAAGVPVVAPDVGVAREAGAIVVAREKLAETVAEVLRRDVRGELKIHLLNGGEWARAWRGSL